MKKVLATFLFLAITPIAAFGGGHGGNIDSNI